MLDVSKAVIVGVPVVVADVAVWRLMRSGDTAIHRIWRCTIFVALTCLLYMSGIDPLSPPSFSGSINRIGIQFLCLVWWLQSALVVTLLLNHLVFPASWRKQRLFHDIAAGLIFGAAIVTALSYVLGLPLNGLMATSGAMAVILGLAIQNTLNDMLSGLILNTTEPFRLNELISVGDVEGKVIESNWRATKLINDQGNRVTVPNSVAAKATIVNLSEPPNIHGATLVAHIAPEIRPGVVIRALQRTAASSLDVLASPAPVATVKTFASDSIEYELICYVESPSSKPKVQSQLYDLLHRHLTSAGVELRSLSVPPTIITRESRRLRLLRAVELFQSIDNADLAALAETMTEHQFDVGEVIYLSNSDERLLTIVDSGIASVSVPGTSGEVEIRRMVPGDAIGQSAVLAGAKLHATVRAVTPVATYRLMSKDLSPLLKRKPELGQLMCRSLSEHRSVEDKLMVQPDKHDEASFSLLAWLERGMKNLHDAVAWFATWTMRPR
jgi:small-conductance mechanosensitive channel